MEFSSNTKGNTGVALGSVGTGLGALALLGGTNVLGNLFGGCNGANTPVTRYELGLENENAKLRSEIALRDASIYQDQKTLELYRYIDGKLEGINSKLCEQAVFNAAQTSAMNCMGGQIAQLFSLTKLSIPNSSVCPGWGSVTVTPATATAGA
jgi:hypothetical protein